MSPSTRNMVSLCTTLTTLGLRTSSAQSKQVRSSSQTTYSETWVCAPPCSVLSLPLAFECSCKGGRMCRLRRLAQLAVRAHPLFRILRRTSSRSISCSATSLASSRVDTRNTRPAVTATSRAASHSRSGCPELASDRAPHVDRSRRRLARPPTVHLCELADRHKDRHF